MPQLTFDGTIVEVRQPETKLQPKEAAILKCLRSHPWGLTHQAIRDFMKNVEVNGEKIVVFDNKLRSLRAKGYVESHHDEAVGELLWYVREGIKTE